MHDLRWLRDHPEAFDAGLGRRGMAPAAGEILSLDRRHRALIAEMQDLQQRRNAASREIGAAKSRGGDAGAQVREVAAIKTRLQEMEAEVREAGTAVESRLAEIPNLPAPEVPDGPDETANRLIREVGAPRLGGDGSISTSASPSA